MQTLTCFLNKEEHRVQKLEDVRFTHAVAERQFPLRATKYTMEDLRGFIEGLGKAASLTSIMNEVSSPDAKTRPFATVSSPLISFSSTPDRGS